MCPALLGNLRTTNILSRRAELAVAMEAVIDGSVMPNVPQVIAKGEVLAKYAPNDASAHVGKYRPYAESFVQTTAFSTGSTAFQVDPTQRGAQWFMVGDVIESTSGTALGTIATYNPTTGVGTLTGNSSNNLAANGTNAVRLAAASWALTNVGMVLQDDCIVESGVDFPTSGYREGFFVAALTNLTAAAVTSLSGVNEPDGSIRLG